MERFLNVDSLELLVERLKNLAGVKNETKRAEANAALARAVYTLENATPKKKLTLQNIKVLDLYGTGGWGFVWRVSSVCYKLKR
jgi:hypothetical protein